MSENERSTHGHNRVAGRRRPMRLTFLGRLTVFLMATVLVAASGVAQSLYWDINGPLAGTGGASPSGLWDVSSTSWSANAAGTAATSPWTPGATAIFSAGVDATGSYGITLSAPQTASGILFEEGTITLSGERLDLIGAGSLTVNASAKATINSVIGGASLGWTKKAVGELVLGAANTFSGSLKVEAGTLTLNDPRAASTGAIEINPASNPNTPFDVVLRSGLSSLALVNDIRLLGVGGSITFEAAPTTTLALNGIISGNHNWVIRGGGKVIIDGARGDNTFDGGLVVSGATLVVAKDQALGGVVNDTTILSGATLGFQGNVIYRALNGSKRVIVNGPGFAGGPAVRNLADDNIFSGDIILAAASTVGVDSGSLNLNGPITGNFNLTKVGTGALDISGVGNNYNSTLVAAGSLGVWGSAIAGNGLMTVNFGALLEGNGRVPGGVNLSGTLAPGASPDTLTTGSQTWNGGATYWWEISDFNGTQGGMPGWDFVQINGTLDIAATPANKFTILLSTLNPNDNSIGAAANFDNTAEYTFPILTASGGILGFDTNKFVVDSSLIMNRRGNGVFFLEQSGNSLVVRFIQKPIITQGLVNQTIERCRDVTLTVNATGTAPLHYAWTFNGAPVGTDSPSLLITGFDLTKAGTYAVTVSNFSGATATSTAVLTITDPPPSFVTFPANITVETAPDATSCGAVVTWAKPTLTDNCTAPEFIDVIADPDSGSTFQVGTTLVTYTAADKEGNVTNRTFTVKVLDKTRPFVVVTPIPVVLDDTGRYTLNEADKAAISAGSTDNCSVTNIVVEPEVVTFCQHEVTVTVTDASGNSASLPVTLDVQPPAAPTMVYVDARYPASCAEVTFPHVGGTGAYFVGFNAFRTIGEALAKVAANGTVNVAAGDYRETLAVTKPVKLIGPNAGKTGTAADRVAEAIIRPLVNDPENTPIISLGADGVVVSGVTVDGFELNGNNPDLSGGYDVDGVLVQAAAGVQNGVYPDLYDVNTITIQNNVIKNFSYDGVYLDRYEFFTTSSASNYIRNNKFEKLWEAVLTYGVDSQIVNNTVASAAKGISVHVAVVPAPRAFVPTIANNTISFGQFSPVELNLERSFGIWVNYRRASGSPLSVVGNVINTPVAPGPGKKFIGIYALSLEGNDKATFVDNVVNGAGNCAQGVFVSMSPTPDAMKLRGGQLTGITETGVRVDNVDPTWGTNDVYAIVENVTIQVAPGAVGVQAIQQPGTTAVAGVIVRGGSSITGGAIGVDVVGGKALIEQSALTGCSLAGIRVTGDGVVDAGDCTDKNLTGLGSSVGQNTLTGYGFDGAAPWIVLNSATTTVYAYRNNFGAVGGDYIGLGLAGDVRFSQVGGAPIVCPPAPATVQCEGGLPIPFTTFEEFLAASGTVPASEGVVTYSDEPVPTSPGRISVTRTYTLTDVCGVASTCSQVITVADTTAPEILACAAPVTLQTGAANCLATVPNFTLAITADDNCTPVEDLEITQNPRAGEAVPKGAHTVIVTVTDAAGNAASCAVLLTVVDVTPPVLNCPRDFVLATAPGSCMASNVVIRAATAFENCGSYTITGVRSDADPDTNLPGLTDPYPRGVTAITWTAKDSSGNTSQCVQLVTVEDRERPVIDCPANITQKVDAGQNYATVNFTVGATDNCGAVTVETVPASGSRFNLGSTAVVATATDAAGNTSTCTFTVTVQAPPIIVAQPQSVALPAGSDAVFTVVVDTMSTLPITYKWYRNDVLLINGGNISGADTAQLTVASITKADEGTIKVVLSNAAGEAMSDPATLTVLDPLIVSQPQSLRLPLGSEATFTVDVAGTAPFAFQWLRDGTALVGATGAKLVIPSVRESDHEATFQVIVTNAVGSLTSAVAVLEVSRPPVIAVQPKPAVVFVGGSTNFTVSVNGAGPLLYQWYYQGIAIPGATFKTLELKNVTTDYVGQYKVIVSNRDGSDESDSASLTVLGGPVIVAGPQSRTNNASTTASFSVSATGASLSYQWFFNTTNKLADGGQVSGSTSNVLTIGEVLAANAGEYSVVVSNNAGSVTSTNAVLVVIDPVILAGPVGRTNALGSTATFSVAAGGTDITYQWRWNGMDIMGENGSTLTINQVADSDAGEYTVVVSGANGSITSAPAILVTRPPIIRDQPVSLTLAVGQRGQLTVGADGEPPFTYQWERFVAGQWLAIPGANERIYTIQSASADDLGTYRVIVSNEWAPQGEISAPATVVIDLPPGFVGVSAASSGALKLSIVGDAGKSYIIESTHDFVNWEVLAKGIAPFTVVQPNTGESQFYRAVLNP